MSKNPVTINEMISQMLSEARRLGYSETTIWRNLFPRLRSVAVYYGKKGIAVYDPETT